MQKVTFLFIQYSVDDRGRMSFVLKGGKTQINFSRQSMKVGLPLSSALDSSWRKRISDRIGGEPGIS